MTSKNLWIAVLILVFLSCNEEDEVIVEDKQGLNMLLIGNSFFGIVNKVYLIDYFFLT